MNRGANLAGEPGLLKDVDSHLSQLLLIQRLTKLLMKDVAYPNVMSRLAKSRRRSQTSYTGTDHQDLEGAVGRLIRDWRRHLIP